MTPLALATGASTGIGRACATHLESRGFHVLASVRDEADAPPGLEPLRLDVTSETDVAAAARLLPDSAFDALIRRAPTSGDR